MIVKVNDYRKLVKEAKKDGFKQNNVPGVPVVDLRKGNIRFCVKNGEIHISEESLEYVKSKNFEYTIIKK